MSWALVTGAGVRVGQAIALALAEDGFDLVVHANNSSLDGVVAGIEGLGRKAIALRADLSDAKAVQGFAAEVRAAVPSLEVLVHNAGIFEKRAFSDISLEDFRKMVGVNLEAPFFLTQQLLPSLAVEGCVVFVADILAARCPPGYAHYMVSKAGLVALTRGLSVELAPVRVNAVAPGTVAFPPDMNELVRASITSKIPAGRVGTPEDIGRTVVFLARSDFVSGQVIAVDGGRDAVH